jgi:hypothetical protein
VLAFLHILLELREVRAERIASRHHAYELAAFHHRHMPKAAFVHEVEGVPERPVRGDGLRRVRHDMLEARRVRLEVLCKHAIHDIAFGEDPAEPALLDNGNCADVAGFHERTGLAHTGFSRCDEEGLVRDELSDRSGRHYRAPERDEGIRHRVCCSVTLQCMVLAGDDA